jgi:hypothetical protein
MRRRIPFLDVFVKVYSFALLRGSVTGTYARSTPEVLEEAVNKLTEPRGAVLKFERKAS